MSNFIDGRSPAVPDSPWAGAAVAIAIKTASSYKPVIPIEFFALRAGLEGWHYGFLTGRG